MSRTMISRPICTPCAGSGIEALAFWVDDEEAEECGSCGGTGYDPRLSTCNHDRAHSLNLATTEDYA